MNKLHTYSIALFFSIGAIAGILLAPQMSGGIRRGILAFIIVVAMVFLAMIFLSGKKSERKKPGQYIELPSGNITEAEEFVKMASSNEILSPEDAREWLDDFLAKQQKDTHDS